jgi:hypothetical protein
MDIGRIGPMAREMRSQKKAETSRKAKDMERERDRQSINKGGGGLLAVKGG